MAAVVSRRDPTVNVFKKIIIRYVDAQGHQVRKDTPGATKVQEFSRKYYGRVPGQLARELETFQVKLTEAGNETFESWRERDHDDLVLAVALVCWGATS